MNVMLRASTAVVFGAALLVGATPCALAQTATEPSSRIEALERDVSGLFGGLFGRSSRLSQGSRGDPAPARPDGVQLAQASPADMILRIEQLENQIRQLTGLVEQLQFRNQQLERQLRRGQEEPDPRSHAGEARALPPAGAGPGPGPQVSAAPEPVPPPPAAQRSADVFDPTQNPGAPGAPRTLGTLSSRAGLDPPARPDEPAGPGGQGEPLDLAAVTGRAATEPPPAVARPAAPGGGLPPPPPRNPNATGVQPQRTVMAPSNTPRDEFDLAYGYLQRKDYALAEQGLRAFLKKYPSDALVSDANYWLGESLFLRQRYRDAAEAFLNVSTKFETSAKAPDALLRLGQSLAALKEREAACATLAEVGRKFPRASPSVRQGAQREMKRVGC